MLKAVTRQATAVDSKIKDLNAHVPPGRPLVSTANFFDHHATPEDIAVMVTEQDFLEANRELIPSVSAGELHHYEAVRATFEGGRDKREPAGRPTNGQVTAAPHANEAAPDGPRSSGKGKGKAIVGKGKGKVVAGDSEDESDDDGQAYGSYGGSINGKGKGKGKAIMSFEQSMGSDDDGLY